ncbi:MAG: MFS transporter [Anaerolineae bacterium]|nr:MFS transporter [Anaerolineae bacterium]
MTTADVSPVHLPVEDLDEQTYKRRIWAWTMYDWANSAFATTILAAVLPAYYSSVAGATLPSRAVATGYWSIGISLSLFIAAILSPILGTVSDVMRGKKRFLSVFVGFGVVATGLLVLVDTGDWMLASILFVVGRIGFTGANVFYDAMLQHVAKEDDQDRVSTRGYAMGYLGGGLLLAINVVMIFVLPGTWGPRLSFLSVAIWWAVFSIPLFRNVPEPPAAVMKLKAGMNVISASFSRIMDTLRDIRHYSELFKYLIAFLIYNDGIGTIISIAVIYGAELGFGDTELVLALLLVQFVGIPFSLIFGRLPSKAEKRRPLYLAFILFNLVALPLLGLVGRSALPLDLSGAQPAPYAATSTAVGEGTYLADDTALSFDGTWVTLVVAADEIGAEADVNYATSTASGARYALPFNGQSVEITYSTGPDRGLWAVELDGEPFIADPEAEDAAPLVIDGYSATVRYGVTETITAAEAGEHVLTLVNTGEMNEASGGSLVTLAQIEVLPPHRQSSLPLILVGIVLIQVLGALFAFTIGQRLVAPLAEALDTRRSILLALLIYSVIAVWAFFLDSTVEYWFLAWMVAIVQGGSQALSRSLYASLSPAAKSGEFFGLYGVMEKFSAILGPLLFAAAAAIFGSSRPAILSLIALFIIGGFLLMRVNIAEGHRVAREEDAAFLAGAEGA